MDHRVIASMKTLAVAMAVLSLPATPVMAQSNARTPWGHPDLQGTWTNGNLTPLQRPDDVAGKELLTSEEWAERDAVARLSDDYSPQGPVGWYNDF